MLERLDDPTPPVAGSAARDAVQRRARALRARRRAVVGLCSLVIVVAASAGLISLDNSPSSIASTQTVYDFNALRSPVPVGTPVPVTALVNVVFAGPRSGYAIAAQRGQALLAVTTDGGNAWKVQDSDLPGDFGQHSGFPGQIEFVGARGYLWGGSVSSNAAPLFITDDGGRTWHQASIGADVYDVSAIGENVWAIAGCPQGASGCTLTVDSSSDGGATWSQVGGPTLVGPADPSVSAPVELARITTDRAYVLSENPQADITPLLVLSYTPDGGRSWVNRPVPCAGPDDLGAEIAASGTDDLWLLCGSQGSGGSQGKDLFRSEDGGHTWVPTSATGAGTLPVSGFISPVSVGHRNLAVASPSTAWIKPSGASVYKTTDGGHTWAPVADLDAAELGSGGEGNITFISATQGWVCAYGVGLWHTTDGEHWAPLGE